VLDSFAQGAAEQPFFLMMSFPDPHHPFTPPGKYWDLYSAGQASLPESFHAPAPPGSLLYAARRAAEEPGYDREAAMTFLPLTERQAKEAIALSCGMIAMIDDAVAAVLARLATLGLDRDTVVVFTADHGDFLGDHGIALKGPMHLSSIVKVPFIWADPSRPQAATCDALAGTIDIAQTVLARAGLAGFNGMQGRSLLPEIETGRDTGPGAVLIDEESQRPAFGYAGPVRLRTMITERWRMSLYEHGPHAELFDLREDPHELRNLWNDPGFAKVKAELLERMVRESIHALDTSPAPNRRA
ncbi:MAG: sulfatase-like hydrolase/transferase, partial [Burkholderiales bacterium]|nr:sulfatase-like hydrolase/transferase [Burkholderiales bacterium]